MIMKTYNTMTLPEDAFHTLVSLRASVGAAAPEDEASYFFTGTSEVGMELMGPEGAVGTGGGEVGMGPAEEEGAA
jgi:hypothetical protein